MGIFVLSSCSDYLNVDKYFKDRMTEEKVFASKDYCDNWLAGVYAYLSKNNMMDVGSKGAALHNFADDMFFCQDMQYIICHNRSKMGRNMFLSINSLAKEISHSRNSGSTIDSNVAYNARFKVN